MHICNLNHMPDLSLMSKANFGAACTTATPCYALYPKHRGDPAPTLDSGARFALVAEGREPKGASLSSYHKLLGHRHIILAKTRSQIQEVGCRLKLAVGNKMKRSILLLSLSSLNEGAWELEK